MEIGAQTSGKKRSQQIQHFKSTAVPSKLSEYYLFYSWRRMCLSRHLLPFPCGSVKLLDLQDVCLQHHVGKQHKY